MIFDRRQLALNVVGPECLLDCVIRCFLEDCVSREEMTRRP
jgi:hypothetical protein